jgi:dTMP kinase
MRGVLITFEGVEGSGKSTQAELLEAHLSGLGLAVIRTREPGGTPIGERIRDILLDNRHSEMHARTELLLYLASRNQHVREKLLPAIRAGRVVISDRYSESSLAYQGRGRDLTFRTVSRLDKFATAGLRPDLVIVVDVPTTVGRYRIAGAAPDRLESEPERFHESVRQAYLQLARRAPKRIKVVDGRKDRDALHAEIRGLVRDLLTRKGLARSERTKPDPQAVR